MVPNLFFTVIPSKGHIICNFTVGCTGRRTMCTLTINNMHIYPIHPFLCVTLTWEDPRGDITARESFSGICTSRESKKRGGKYWLHSQDSGTAWEQWKRKKWDGRLSKGSASPSATNDSWRAPNPISGRAASGDS